MRERTRRDEAICCLAGHAWLALPVPSTSRRSSLCLLPKSSTRTPSHRRGDLPPAARAGEPDGHLLPWIELVAGLMLLVAGHPGRRAAHRRDEGGLHDGALDSAGEGLGYELRMLRLAGRHEDPIRGRPWCATWSGCPWPPTSSYSTTARWASIACSSAARSRSQLSRTPDPRSPPDAPVRPRHHLCPARRAAGLRADPALRRARRATEEARPGAVQGGPPLRLLRRDARCLPEAEERCKLADRLADDVCRRSRRARTGPSSSGRRQAGAEHG